MKNAGGDEKKRNTDSYKEYKKKKETMKGYQRKQKLEELKNKYGNFGQKPWNKYIIDVYKLVYY